MGIGDDGCDCSIPEFIALGPRIAEGIGEYRRSERDCGRAVGKESDQRTHAGPRQYALDSVRLKGPLTHGFERGGDEHRVAYKYSGIVHVTSRRNRHPDFDRTCDVSLKCWCGIYWQDCVYHSGSHNIWRNILKEGFRSNLGFFRCSLNPDVPAL